eukprot:366136-Chlamydomonas_euryale.AAC.2
MGESNSWRTGNARLRWGKATAGEPGMRHKETKKATAGTKNASVEATAGIKNAQVDRKHGKRKGADGGGRAAESVSAATMRPIPACKHYVR